MARLGGSLTIAGWTRGGQRECPWELHSSLDFRKDKRRGWVDRWLSLGGHRVDSGNARGRSSDFGSSRVLHERTVIWR